MEIERADATEAIGLAGDPVLLERESELAEIERACGVVEGGEGACILITAPGGLGKTELIARARSAAGERSMATLWAGGAELEREFAFGVARQLFEPVLARLADDERAEVLSGAAAGALSVLGGTSAEPAADSDGFATLHSLYWLALGLADRGPLVLLVDDAHLADVPSLRFLAFLARRLEGHPILLAVASRPQPSRAASAALDELRASPASTLLSPEPLAPASAAGFLAAQLGRDPEPEFADACHTATGGNPFLLGELAKTIASEGMEAADSNAGMVTRLGPASVSRAVLARLAALGPDTVALARAVAVLGRRTEIRDAAALAGLGEAAASSAADQLVEAGVLERGRPLQFVHAIVRHAIYEDIAPGERAEAHARAARVLGERHAEPERIATHLLACEPAADPWAYEQLLEVADRALAQGAPPIAIQFLRRALDEPPPRGERPGLLARLGSIEVRAGRQAGVPRLRDAHGAAPDARSRAEVARELGGALIFSGHATEAASLLTEAIEELESSSAPDTQLAARLESLLLAAGVVTSGGHHIAQRRYAEIEQRIGKLPEDAARLVSAPLALERVTCGGTAPLGVHLARRALGDGRLITEEGPESPLLFVAVAALLWSDRGAEAQEAINAAIGRIEATGSARGLALTLPSRALVRLRCGALAEAEADARMGLELGGEAGGWLVFRMIGAAVLATVLLERGDLSEAAEVLDAIDRVPRDPDAVLTQPLREAQARLRLARGEPERALGVLLACQERERSWRIRSVTPIPWRSHAAIARLALGEPAEALRLANDELRLAKLFDAPRPIGVAMRTVGLVEGGERGLQCLAEAAEVLEDSSDRLEYARALVELGAATRRGGRKADARGPLGDGLDLARACGATALAERAYEELRATGARPRKMLYTGVEALTPSERRVAAMAAEGMSNREIAQSLFVTPKTVEVHLSHCYRKLEISSRRELPRALGEP